MDVVRAAPPCFDNRCPVTDVKAVFEHIAVMRMRGLPIVNPALGVEALSFRRWAGEWLGVLITPWSLSLMLLPGGGAPLFVCIRARISLGRFHRESMTSSPIAKTDWAITSCARCIRRCSSSTRRRARGKPH